MSEMLQRKQTEHPAWHLADKVAMIGAFSDLMEDGWRGGVNPLGDGYRLELNRGDQNMTADIGDWLVDDYGLRKITAEERAANYDVVEA